MKCHSPVLNGYDVYWQWMLEYIWKLSASVGGLIGIGNILDIFWSCGGFVGELIGMRCALGIRRGLGFMQRRTGQLALMHTGHLLCAQQYWSTLLCVHQHWSPLMCTPTPVTSYVHTNTGQLSYGHTNTGHILYVHQHSLLCTVFTLIMCTLTPLHTGHLWYAHQHWL